MLVQQQIFFYRTNSTPCTLIKPRPQTAGQVFKHSLSVQTYRRVPHISAGCSGFHRS